VSFKVGAEGKAEDLQIRGGTGRGIDMQADKQP